MVPLHATNADATRLSPSTVDACSCNRVSCPAHRMPSACSAITVRTPSFNRASMSCKCFVASCRAVHAAAYSDASVPNCCRFTFRASSARTNSAISLSSSRRSCRTCSSRRRANSCALKYATVAFTHDTNVLTMRLRDPAASGPLNSFKFMYGATWSKLAAGMDDVWMRSPGLRSSCVNTLGLDSTLLRTSDQWGTGTSCAAARRVDGAVGRTPLLPLAPAPAPLVRRGDADVADLGAAVRDRPRRFGRRPFADALATSTTTNANGGGRAPPPPTPATPTPTPTPPPTPSSPSAGGSALLPSGSSGFHVTSGITPDNSASTAPMATMRGVPGSDVARISCNMRLSRPSTPASAGCSVAEAVFLASSISCSTLAMRVTYLSWDPRWVSTSDLEPSTTTLRCAMASDFSSSARPSCVMARRSSLTALCISDTTATARCKNRRACRNWSATVPKAMLRRRNVARNVSSKSKKCRIVTAADTAGGSSDTDRPPRLPLCPAAAPSSAPCPPPVPPLAEGRVPRPAMPAKELGKGVGADVGDGAAPPASPAAASAAANPTRELRCTMVRNDAQMRRSSATVLSSALARSC